mgnify:CR=1 FL=1
MSLKDYIGPDTPKKDWNDEKWLQHAHVMVHSPWIDDAESILEKTGGNSILQRPEIKERVIEHIENARINATRMKEGLRLLEDDDAARTAFRLSNAAISFYPI